MTNYEGWQLLEYDELSSTNDKAIELCFNPPSPQFVVTAVRQTGGRGRRGRRWVSMEGNLFMTQALPLKMRFCGDLVFIVSLSLWESVHALAPKLNLKLKWPNDVLADGCKISGILLEKAENGYIIAGIGVNIAMSPAQEKDILYQTAALSDFGIKTDCRTFLKSYLSNFNRNYSLWQKQGFAAIKDRWMQNAKGLGEEICVNMENAIVKGIFEGISNTGRLLLRQDGKMMEISAGDVFYKKEN